MDPTAPAGRSSPCLGHGDRSRHSLEGAPGAGVAGPPARALSLDVLTVYSGGSTRSLLVVINGKKYVRGQTLDGDAVLEQITQDGAVLRQRGRRIVLRPAQSVMPRARGRLDTIAVALGQWLEPRR